jgi:branched-subunit amino acid transport protein
MEVSEPFILTLALMNGSITWRCQILAYLMQKVPASLQRFLFYSLVLSICALVIHSVIFLDLLSENHPTID